MPIAMDEDLRVLLEGGVATVIGTRDTDLAPEIARGWGNRVLTAEGMVEVCIGLPSGQRTLANLAAHPQLAVTCVRPSDYRQVQLKGRLVATTPPTDDDRARVRRHREAFRDEVGHVGIAPELVDGFWDHDDPAAQVKLLFVVEEAYDQTPGPKAGQPL